MAERTTSAHHPYPGPHPYGLGDSTWFSGREAEAQRAAALWCSNQVTVLAGSSGVGKTSLLNAGIFPLLDKARFDVRPPGRVTNHSVFPAAALFEHNPLVLAFLTALAETESPTLLSRMSISEFLRQHQRLAIGKPCLIALDQAEECFRDHRRVDRQRFFDQLAEVLRDHPDVHLLIVIREEWLGSILADERLTVDATMMLGPLGRKAAIEAVSLPAALAGKPFSGDAAEELVEQLMDPPILGKAPGSSISAGVVQPVILQVVCSALSGALPAEAGSVAIAHASGLVDIDQCLASFIASRLMAVAQCYDVRPGRLHSWLVQLLAAAGAHLVNEREIGKPSVRDHILRHLENDYVLRCQRQGEAWHFALPSEHLTVPLQLSLRDLPLDSAPLFFRSHAEWLADAVSAINDGELEIAERLVKYILSVSKGNDFRLRAEAQTLLGNVAFHRDDAERAVRHYFASAELFEALQDHVGVGRLLAAIGRLHLLRGDTTAAINVLYSAASRLPADGAVMLDLALAFASSGEAQAAVAVLGTALAADADVGAQDVHLLRGEILADLGDAATALSELENMPHAQRPPARAARALSLARLGKMDDADEGIGEALQASHDNGPVLLRAAQIRALRGDVVGAERYLRQAIDATTPRLSHYHRGRANSLLEDCHV